MLYIKIHSTKKNTKKNLLKEKALKKVDLFLN